MSDDHTADPIQDRDADDHDKYDLHPRTYPGQPEQGYRFRRAGPIPKGGDKQQYRQKDIQLITYERDILADEFLLVIFRHGDHLVRTDEIINSYGEKTGNLFQRVNARIPSARFPLGNGSS